MLINFWKNIRRMVNNIEKKYELIPSDKEGLYRIKALKDFNDVKKGDIGGYVEGEKNLSQLGDCWIYDNAVVRDNAVVVGNAKVCDNARIRGHSVVQHDAVVRGNANVSGDAIISSDRDYIVFKNWWSSGRYFTWTRSNNMWTVGCFYGTGEELIAKAYKDSEEKGREPYFRKEAMENWKREELKRGLIGGSVTPLFFEVLLSFKEEFENFPMNPNSARRIQDIKDAGYTLASVPRPGGLKGYNRILLPLPLHAEMGYETFTPQFKARVIRLLRERNAFEARVTAKKALIPDHKFSEVRWDDETKAENSMEMTDAEIIQKFQLLDNQRNQQKREICRRCFQEGIRGTIYGIHYFYEGDENWDPNIPKVGKAAEKGCIGCPWYDIELWRKMLNKHI